MHSKVKIKNNPLEPELLPDSTLITIIGIIIIFRNDPYKFMNYKHVEGGSKSSFLSIRF